MTDTRTRPAGGADPEHTGHTGAREGPSRLSAGLLAPVLLAAAVLAPGADAGDPREATASDALAAPATSSDAAEAPPATDPDVAEELPATGSDLAGPADPGAGFVSGRAGVAVAFRDIVTPYRVFLLTALPGERVEIGAFPGVDPDLPAGRRPTAEDRDGALFSLRASAGEVRRLGPDRWEWRAPGRPGYHRLVVRPEAGRDSVALTAAVLVPFERLRSGSVDGYRLGDFPAEPYRGLPQYERPRGFLPLRPDDRDLRVSPHFTLDQFPAKGPAGWPKYLVLEERLLLKLEWLLEEAVRAGVPATTFRVLSGFRSPWYNGGIGRPKYSRHIYGDAADVYVDEDGDGRMDDLNGDGRIDVRDAGVLYDIVDAMDGAPETEHFLGGLGKYRVTPNHGPFIHVDTRLYRARW